MQAMEVDGAKNGVQIDTNQVQARKQLDFTTRDRRLDTEFSGHRDEVLLEHLGRQNPVTATVRPRNEFERTPSFFCGESWSSV